MSPFSAKKPWRSRVTNWCQRGPSVCQLGTAWRLRGWINPLTMASCNQLSPVVVKAAISFGVLPIKGKWDSNPWGSGFLSCQSLRNSKSFFNWASGLKLRSFPWATWDWNAWISWGGIEFFSKRTVEAEEEALQAISPWPRAVPRTERVKNCRRFNFIIHFSIRVCFWAYHKFFPSLHPNLEQSTWTVHP